MWSRDGREWESIRMTTIRHEMRDTMRHPMDPMDSVVCVLAGNAAIVQTNPKRHQKVILIFI